jgi:hypothetical protein
LSKTSLTFREGVAQLTRTARETGEGSVHVPTVRLVAYRRGELAEAEASALAEHLSICPACASELLEIAELFDDAEEETEADERLWRRIEAEIRPALPEVAPEIQPEVARLPLPTTLPAIPPRRPPRSIFRSLPVAYALAAGFAALSLGLFLFGRMHGTDAAPRLNEGLYDLSDRGSERSIREVDRVKTIRFAEGSSSAILILNPTQAPAASGTYGVRFRRANGSVAWQAERGLVPQRLGTFQIGISRDSFSPGRYTVELFEARDGGELPLGTFLVSIEK